MTHKYKIGDWVRVVVNSGHQHKVGHIGQVTQLASDIKPLWRGVQIDSALGLWVDPDDLTPAVMTLAEWNKLLPGGVMVGDVFEVQEARHHAWTEGCRYIVQTNGMIYDDTNNTIPNAERKIQPFTLISRAKEPQMEPQLFQDTNAKPGDVVRCVYSIYKWWTIGSHYTVTASGGLVDDENESRDTPNDAPHYVKFIFTSRAPLTPLTLKAMAPEQAGPIMEVFRQGKPVQAWNNGAWHEFIGKTGLKPGGMYRLPPKPVATMNWTGIHPDITHVAGDEVEMVWLFEGEPHIEGHSWGDVTYMRRIDNILSPCPFQANGADWQDTLIARPKEGGE